MIKPQDQVFANLITQLHRDLPLEPLTRVVNLAALALGILRSKSLQVGQILTALPLTGTRDTLKKRMQRFLRNPSITIELYYEPLARRILQRLAGGGARIHWTIDRTEWGASNLLYGCVGWRGRALPLVWGMLGPGASSFAERKELLAGVAQWLPRGADVLLLGDREFGTGVLAQWALHQDWGVCLRLRTHEYVCRASAPYFARLPLVLPGDRRFWPHVTFTQKHAVAGLTLAMYWAPTATEPWYLITTEPTCKLARASYQKRFRSEIVQTQMTKRHGFPLRAGGDDVADFHLPIADDDSIDEQGDQLSALGKRQMVQSRADAVAKGLDTLGQGGYIHLLLCLEFELAQLLSQPLLGLRYLLMFAFEFLPPDNGGQIDLQQAGLLPLQLCQGLAQRVASSLEDVRQPLPAPGPGQFMGNQGGRGQHPTQILPHQRVQGRGRGRARRAAVRGGGAQGIGASPTGIVGIASGQSAPRAGQLALAATDQAPQQIVRCGIVAPGKPGMAIKPALGRREGLRSDERGHRHGDPLLRRGRALAGAGAEGLQGRFTLAGGSRVRAATIGGAGIGGVAQDTPHRGDIPAGAAAGGGNLRVAEPLGDPIQTHCESFICIPREHLRHYPSLDRIGP